MLVYSTNKNIDTVYSKRHRVPDRYKNKVRTIADKICRGSYLTAEYAEFVDTRDRTMFLGAIRAAAWKFLALDYGNRYQRLQALFDSLVIELENRFHLA